MPAIDNFSGDIKDVAAADTFDNGCDRTDSAWWSLSTTLIAAVRMTMIDAAATDNLDDDDLTDSTLWRRLTTLTAAAWMNNNMQIVPVNTNQWRRWRVNVNW